MNTNFFKFKLLLWIFVICIEIMPTHNCVKLWCSVLKYLVPALDYGWPCPAAPLFCPDPVLPRPLHCAGTAQTGLHTQPDGGTDPAKNPPLFLLPPVFLAKAIVPFSLQHSCRSGVAVRKQSQWSQWEREIVEGRTCGTLKEDCQPLSLAVLAFCLGGFFNWYVEHLVIKIKSWQVYKEDK